jgi:hypothetical protein
MPAMGKVDARLRLRSRDHGASEPHPEDPVWSSLIEKRLVWLDFSRWPPEFQLTPLGWRYRQSS